MNTELCCCHVKVYEYTHIKPQIEKNLSAVKGRQAAQQEVMQHCLVILIKPDVIK